MKEGSVDGHVIKNRARGNSTRIGSDFRLCTAADIPGTALEMESLSTMIEASRGQVNSIQESLLTLVEGDGVLTMRRAFRTYLLCKLQCCKVTRAVQWLSAMPSHRMNGKNDRSYCGTRV